MKKMYTSFSLLLVSFVLVSNVRAQCPDGQPAGGTAFDTTIMIPAGIVAKEVQFPKFDPEAGMVTCVRLCVTIKGIIDTVALQNFSSSAQNASYTYDRVDIITGPGIPTFLSSNANLSFGPFPLTLYDGIPGAGTDFYSKGSDTVLTRVLCANINDSATIAQFYGIDSVSYNYDVNASAVGIVPGGSSSALVLSSAMVNFRFEYCTCPAAVLPVNIYDFTLNKLSDVNVDLKWGGYDEIYANYYYEAEVSRDGNNFTSIGTVPKNAGNDPYKFSYTAPAGETGVYYFRIKQVYSNGYIHYSNIRQVVLENSVRQKFSVYPNPSTGIVGIKFDNSLSGHFYALLYNTQGQVIEERDIAVRPGSAYMEIAKLTPGVYWLRLTDKKSLESSVTQLLIK
ncbi:MAG TPA: choice-of-anchor E domain-containing protein [Chitinophagaceae bacterium]|nr:choice-of-anchor E domain-containing protein [Chitinophagaceae bacterium]